MTAILLAWVRGVGLGLAIAAPLGPINVEIIRRHLGSGLAAGLLLGLGACSVDTFYIIAISLGLVTLQPSPAVQGWMLAASGAILLTLAGLILTSSVRSARRAADAQAGSAAPVRPLRHYLVGLAMTASSPMNLIFWIGVVASGQYVSHAVRSPWPVVAGVMCGTVGWVVGLNGVLIAGRRLLRPGVLMAVNWLGAGLLIFYAGWALWRFATIIIF
ncbi:MAG: hypothetical protein BIFFINMI_00562 [Phycisphaerae bacterium]|nr:hypothetical protein [Phycisphaerae bacterium]